MDGVTGPAHLSHMLYPPISEVVLVAEPQAGVGNTRKASRDATVRYAAFSCAGQADLHLPGTPPTYARAKLSGTLYS